MLPSQTVAPNVTIIRASLSRLEQAVLIVLEPRHDEPSDAALTFDEIGRRLYLQEELTFTQGGLALALVRLQELNLVANTLAYRLRTVPEGDAKAP